MSDSSSNSQSNDVDGVLAYTSTHVDTGKVPHIKRDGEGSYGSSDAMTLFAPSTTTAALAFGAYLFFEFA